MYQLSEFPEYRELTLPVIEYYLEETSNQPDDSLFRKALLRTKARLRSEPLN